MVFDFNKIDRETFDIILPNEEEVTLHILRPLKKQFEKLMDVAEQLVNISKTMQATPEQQKILKEISAMVLSRNTDGKVFTVEDVEERFDTDDLFFFIDGYLDFIYSLAKIKNSNSPTAPIR